MTKVTLKIWSTFLPAERRDPEGPHTGFEDYVETTKDCRGNLDQLKMQQDQLEEETKLEGGDSIVDLDRRKSKSEEGFEEGADAEDADGAKKCEID